MKLSAKNLKLVLILLAVILCVEIIGASVFIQAQDKTCQKLFRQAAIAKREVETQQINLNRAQTELQSHDLGKIRITSSNNINDDQLAELLKQISKLIQNLEINYLSMQAQPDADFNEYRKRSFSLKAVSGFNNLVNFINELENNLRLTISNLEIKHYEDIIYWHEASFVLSSIEMKPANSLPVMPPVPQNNALKNSILIAKDPFISQYRKELLAMSCKNKDGAAQKTGFALTGIMDLMGKKAAIINGAVVKEGELVLGYSVAKIDTDTVILRQNDKVYKLRFKDSLSKTNGDFKKGITVKAQK